MANALPLSIAVAGLGGYAGYIRKALLEREAAPNATVALKAICEPDLETHAGLAKELRGKGILIVNDFAELLRLPIDAVWLPLPIHLHKKYTLQALQAGKAVMCEKPAAGAIQDLHAMIDARDASGLPVAIGFQDIYKPSTATLKTAINDGVIGSIKSAAVSACWPRDSGYYARSQWAGKQFYDGTWVMDSPASNALAHFLNLALYLIGDGRRSADIVKVEAELYRANSIENYDTCAMRYLTENGVSLLVCFTHACRETREPILSIIGERGRIDYSAGKEAKIRVPAQTTTISLRDEGPEAMIDTFAHLAADVPDQRAVATLEIAKSHLIGVNAASEAAAVRQISQGEITRVEIDDYTHLLTIPGVEDLFDYCAQNHLLPSETRRAEWAVPAGALSVSNYNYFNGPKVC